MSLNGVNQALPSVSHIRKCTTKIGDPCRTTYSWSLKTANFRVVFRQHRDRHVVGSGLGTKRAVERQKNLNYEGYPYVPAKVGELRPTNG